MEKLKNETVPPSLIKERTKTDKSLTAERKRTNESIEEARKETELRTDRIVSEERLEADKTTSTGRSEADIHREIERDTSKHFDAKIDLKKSADRLLNERRAADGAVEKERSQVDAAIKDERKLKNTIAKTLLKNERSQTDQNLQEERMRTDTEARQVKGQLVSEIENHSKTKVSLTTRDEFLAIVSHDLRNPIGAVSSAAEILLEDSSYKKMESSEIEKWLEIIQRNSNTALRLIGDLLEMESIANGKFQLKLKPQSINKIIQESIESFVRSRSAKKVQLTAVPATFSRDISFDHDRILQVLSNLVGNAIKFTPEGGAIEIAAKLTKDEMQVSIRDNGPGIPVDKKDFIFGRFSQLGSQDRKGLGLGLYVSKLLIEAHNGRIWVESEIGKGSTFFFTIPLSPA